jgi:hypothetical protein
MKSIQRYKTRYAALKAAKQMVGWKTKVFLEDGEYYIIQCNGCKYLMSDGFVR